MRWSWRAGRPCCLLLCGHRAGRRGRWVAAAAWRGRLQVCMHATCMSQDDAVCTATRDVWPRWCTGVAPIVAARLRAGCSSAACRRGRTCTRPQEAARTANQGVGTAARQAPTAPSAPLQHRPALVIASRSARRCQHQHQPACPAMPFLCADGHTAALSPSRSPPGLQSVSLPAQPPV